ncbi:hypothetical protein [Streptomyces sp. NPDC005970]|uniref:NACHT domain-containing protein n=1 Tax=Streptomyces sp. NPDC005970 TaxID=3156723 RepID=UPI0033E6E9AC
MSGAEEPVSGRAALAAQLGLLQAGLRQRGKTQKAAVEEANRRRRRAAGRPEDLAWPRKDGGVDLSLQAVNDWFPKQKGSKEPSAPADFEDLWSLVAVMLEWTRQLTDKRSRGRLRYDWNKLYEDAQRGTGLDEEVRAYLEAVRKVAEQHPHPGIPGWTAPSLAEVYVRQRSTPLTRDRGDASRGNDSATAGSGPGLPAEAEPAEAVFRKADRVCVLIAGPGCGKSTLLRTQLGEAAGEWLDGAGSTGKTGAVVPVWVNARSLAGEETQVPDALAAATRSLSRYGRHPELGTDRFLERPCTGAYWQLLVDGLDELPNAAERRAVLEKLANAVAEDPPLYRCVVATRPLTGNELDVLDRVLGYRAPRYDLQPFTPGDLHTYTEKYFGTRWRQEEAARRAQQFTGALRSASLAELARTPLMSFMLCQLYLAEPERPLPEGRTAVYEAFTDLIYENNHSKHVADSHEDAIKNLVEGLQSPRARQEADKAARQVHEQLPELIDYLAHQRLIGDQAPAAATLASHETLHRPGKVRPELWEAFVQDLLRHTGLLVHQPDGLSFPHQTLLEYHAARHATRDRHARRQTLHELFGPGEPAPGQWQNQEPSYLGFLLDQLLSSHDDRISEETKACLAAATSGERKRDFLVQQVRLRTNLPAESTARQLARYYADYPRYDDRSSRRALAEVLAMVDQGGWGVQLLESRSSDPTLDDYSRFLRTKDKMEVERAARLLETRANEPILYDSTLSFSDRLATAEALTKVDLERAVRLLEALAIDDTAANDFGNRWAAVAALEKVDPVQGGHLQADFMLQAGGGFL